ncbi:hypothetical protein [Streptomyces sp. NPDC059788]|uniref:hypothetical protein n=1 Tax=Streptomyces sp. NPDC059788 TaxID=3346948 RepID=UPI003647C245
MATTSRKPCRTTIDDDACYMERMNFADGRNGKAKVFSGCAVRARFEALEYTDSGEEPAYGEITQNPQMDVIAGVSSAPTAVWSPITAEEAVVGDRPQSSAGPCGRTSLQVGAWQPLIRRTAAGFLLPA